MAVVFLSNHATSRAATRRCVGLVLLACLMQSDDASVSEDEDLVVSYTVGHGPSHSHCHVRDCQSATHSDTTYETWPSSRHDGLPVAESTVFTSETPVDTGTSRWVYGHVTVVRDPLRTFSVLEPGGPGGCGVKRRATVEHTALRAGCLYAQNAGFFNTTTDGCLGNVVSDGRTVRDSGGVQNAQFGIRRDGSLVVGYLSQEDVLDRSNPFVQLVSGVVWLLRNGEVYINQSMEAECNIVDMEVFRDLVDVLSARTVVGHDAEGNVVLFHVDGQTLKRGMNLWEVAEFLKRNGVINAINLDGGGSSSFVVNGTLASYPSDTCKSDSRRRCARPVSTVLCVHQRRCTDGKTFASRRQHREETCGDNAYLTEQTWMIITVALVSLLLIRRLLHFMRASRRWLLFGYFSVNITLTNIRGDAGRLKRLGGRGNTCKTIFVR